MASLYLGHELIQCILVMQHLRSGCSSIVRQLLREQNRHSDYAIASMWPPDSLKAASISLAVRSFARQRRRAHESHEDPPSDIAQPDDATYAAHEDLQPVPDAPGGSFRHAASKLCMSWLCWRLVSLRTWLI